MAAYGGSLETRQQVMMLELKEIDVTGDVTAIILAALPRQEDSLDLLLAPQKRLVGKDLGVLKSC